MYVSIPYERKCNQHEIFTQVSSRGPLTEANSKKYLVSGATGDENKSQPGGRKKKIFLMKIYGK